MFDLKKKRDGRKLGAPAFFLGAVLGIHLMVGALSGAVILMLAQEADAQGTGSLPPNCFFRTECLNSKTDKKFNCDQGCDKPDTICHCFEAGHGCKDGGGFCYQKWPAVKLQIPIGGSTVTLDLADYIARMYNYAVGAAAAVAASLMVVGGFQWMTAGGQGNKVQAGKKRIFDAAIGLILAICALVILNTINPDLIALRLPKIPLVRKATFVGCRTTEMCVPCNQKYTIMRPKDAPPNWVPPNGDCKYVAIRPEQGDPPKGCPECQKWTDDLAQKYVLSADCDGRSCRLAGCTSDAQFRCRKAKPDEKRESDCAVQNPPPATDSSSGTNAPTNAPVGDLNTFYCKACKQDGEKCSPGGKNDICCGGFCGDGYCSAGEPGDPCASPNDCQNGLCTTEWLDLPVIGGVFPHTCSAGAVGNACNKDADCANGYKCSTFGRNTCSPGTHYAYCDDNKECGPGLVCSSKGWFMANVCLYPGEQKQECATATSKALLIAQCIIDCTAPVDNLGYNEYCPDKLCVQSPADLSPGGVVGSICSNGAPGTPCGADDQCVKPAWKTGDRGMCIDNICMSGQLGELCRDAKDCESGRCLKAKKEHVFRTSSFCVSGNLGSRCDSTTGCDDSKNLSCQDGVCRFK